MSLPRFDIRNIPYFLATGRNAEGFPAFQLSPQEQYVQMLLTNTLGGTFYANQLELVANALSYHRDMAHSDPEFMARALVYARQSGMMRLQPILGLVHLSVVRRDLFARIFDRIILTPHDLSSFVEAIRNPACEAAFSRAIKRQISAWLNQISEYHAIKYASGGNSYALRDILSLCHTHPADEQHAAIFAWLMDHKRWHQGDYAHITPQIDALETLKRTQNRDLQGEIITSGKLPYEVITGFLKPDVDLWGKLLFQMPYLALLRHLNTIQRAGLFQHIPDSVGYIADRLSDLQALRKARVLPFQIYQAYQNFESQMPAERIIMSALEQALQASSDHLPYLGKRICIAPDVSGSMTGQLSETGATRYIDIAALLAAAAYRRSSETVVMPFDTTVRFISLSQENSLIQNAESIVGLCGGGTAVSAPISELLNQQIKVDTFIGITDNEEWARDSYGRSGFLSAWNQYKQFINPRAKAFLITIAPYSHAIAPAYVRDVHYIYGWSDLVLTYIATMNQSHKNQIDHIRQMQI
jgi:60 kDa SS-A/Ro ribonucleoprotein